MDNGIVLVSRLAKLSTEDASALLKTMSAEELGSFWGGLDLLSGVIGDAVNLTESEIESRMLILDAKKMELGKWESSLSLGDLSYENDIFNLKNDLINETDLPIEKINEIFISKESIDRKKLKNLAKYSPKINEIINRHIKSIRGPDKLKIQFKEVI